MEVRTERRTSMGSSYSVKEQVQVLNRHDADAFAGFYTPSALLYDPQYPEPLKGREAIRKDMADFIRAFPDLTFDATTIIEQGATVAFEGTGKGTHRGPLTGPAGEIAATNRPVEMKFAAFLRVENGLIAEERRYYDLAGLMQQLGVSG
jgi:steroid delta-isomerase-like uncharacterized protein